MNKKKQFLKIQIVQLLFLIVGLAVWGAGWISHNFNLLAGGMLFIFLQNILYAADNIRERIVFLVFHGAIFTFLLARPILGMVSGEKWWLTASQAEENIRFAILLITLSMLALFFGAVIITILHSKLKSLNKLDRVGETARNKRADEFRKYLRFSATIVFVIAVIFFFWQEAEKLIFIRERSYVDYYASFQSTLPGYVHTLAGFMPYSLCVFLATLPTKRQAFLPLVLFWISAIPSLIIGMRNPIVLNSIFVFLYYFIRDVMGDEKKWIGKYEKRLLIVVIPIMIIFMFSYAYIRSGTAVETNNPLSMITKFFYAQGVTFEVLAMGFGYRFNLPVRVGRNYTFGGMIDYIVHGRVGQLLFHTAALPDGNNLINARESNSLAHNLSYVIKRDDYLNGHGWGSSYLLENYFDFGYAGVIILSILLGILLVGAIYLFKKQMLIRTIVLMAMTTIFFAPRAEATGWLTFIVTLQFWLCIFACYIGAWILKRIFMEKKAGSDS